MDRLTSPWLDSLASTGGTCAPSQNAQTLAPIPQCPCTAACQGRSISGPVECPYESWASKYWKYINTNLYRIRYYIRYRDECLTTHTRISPWQTKYLFQISNDVKYLLRYPIEFHYHSCKPGSVGIAQRQHRCVARHLGLCTDRLQQVLVTVLHLGARVLQLLASQRLLATTTNSYTYMRNRYNSVTSGPTIVTPKPVNGWMVVC